MIFTKIQFFLNILLALYCSSLINATTCSTTRNVEPFDSEKAIQQRFLRDIKDIDDVSYEDLSKQKIAEIVNASIRILKVLQTLQFRNEVVPKDLILNGGKAFGHLSCLDPKSLQYFEETILYYLCKKDLTYSDIRTPKWNFKFGEEHDVTDTTTAHAMKMPNGQQVYSNYYINIPVYFNRLPQAYNGSFLLIGGGEKCECDNPSQRHPKSHFYQIDIDNVHNPDAVLHAGYLQHLYTLPHERFNFVWFEHCSIPNMMIEEDVLEQYFRIVKPGGIFLWQSHYNLTTNKNLPQLRATRDNFEKLLRKTGFTILEYKEYKVRHKGLNKIYSQIIYMKPFSKSLYRKRSNAIFPTIKVNRSEYRDPYPNEINYILPILKKFANQKGNLLPSLDDLNCSLQILELISGQAVIKWNLPEIEID